MTIAPAVPAAPVDSPVPAAAPAPSAIDMLRAIRAVQLQQATKIGAACVALTGTCKTPLVMADLAEEVEILAGLDLAATVLQGAV